MQLETLEDRLPLATDVLLQAFTAAGQAELTVRYEIIGDAPAFFTIDFLTSADAVWDAGDVWLDQVILDDAADLTAGEHTKTFALGGADGQVALPVASAADYFLLAVADLNEQLLENDIDPRNEDNLAVFRGAYHQAGGGVMVHGTASRDVIVVSGSRGVQSLQLNGLDSTYLKGNYTRFYIHAHEGDDYVNGKTSAKDLFVWGAEGNDSLTGGLRNDRLYGGEGADRLSGLGGNDLLDGHGGTDTFVTGYGRDTLRPGSEVDIIVWNTLLRAARTRPVNVTFAAAIAATGTVVGEGSGTLDISVRGTGTLAATGRFNGSFNATGHGGGAGDGCVVTYSGNASGTVIGPLAKAAVRGSFAGSWVERCGGRVERGTESGAFSGTAFLKDDKLRVQINAEDTRGTGIGEFSVIVTKA